MRIVHCMTPQREVAGPAGILTAAEASLLAALACPRTSDRRVAARAGLTLADAHLAAHTLRAKIKPAAGETVVAAARRLQLLGVA